MKTTVEFPSSYLLDMTVLPVMLLCGRGAVCVDTIISIVAAIAVM